MPLAPPAILRPDPDPAGWSAPAGAVQIRFKLTITGIPYVVFNGFPQLPGLTAIFSGLAVRDESSGVQSWLHLSSAARVPMTVTAGPTVAGVAAGSIGATATAAAVAEGIAPRAGRFSVSLVSNVTTVSTLAPFTITPNPQFLTGAVLNVGAVVSVPEGSVRLSWFQAEAEALAGVRIRRAGWATKYLEHSTGLWFIQFFAAATKTLGIRRVVTDADFASADFTALDWTYEGIAGQSAGAGAASAGVSPELRFP